MTLSRACLGKACPCREQGFSARAARPGRAPPRPDSYYIFRQSPKVRCSSHENVHRNGWRITCKACPCRGAGIQGERYGRAPPITLCSDPLPLEPALVVLRQYTARCSSSKSPTQHPPRIHVVNDRLAHIYMLNRKTMTGKEKLLCGSVSSSYHTNLLLITAVRCCRSGANTCHNVFVSRFFPDVALSLANMPLLLL